ncbi:hypothetical protein [Streptomyces sp. NPDC046853]|uniref:hypothetical protein n=1 Tax=unclassified Streptomyces TaxID=2593676 RepID=UPI00340F504F
MALVFGILFLLVGHSLRTNRFGVADQISGADVAADRVNHHHSLPYRAVMAFGALFMTIGAALTVVYTALLLLGKV